MPVVSHGGPCPDLPLLHVFGSSPEEIVYGNSIDNSWIKSCFLNLDRIDSRIKWRKQKLLILESSWNSGNRNLNQETSRVWFKKYRGWFMNYDYDSRIIERWFKNRARWFKNHAEKSWWFKNHRFAPLFDSSIKSLDTRIRCPWFLNHCLIQESRALFPPLDSWI